MPLTIPDQTIATQVRVPTMQDALAPISSLLNMRNQILQNQLGQVELQKNQGTLQPSIDTATANAQRAQTEAQQSKYRFTGEIAQKAFDIAGGLAQDPAIQEGTDQDAMITAIASARQRAIDSGVPTIQAEANFAPLIDMAHRAPGQVKNTLANIIRGGMGAAGQASQALVPAGSQQAIGTGPTGQPFVMPRSQFGQVMAPQALPQQGQMPGQAPIVAPPAGESTQTLPEVMKIRTDANTTAAQVPGMHDNAKNIVALADQLKTGGQLGSTWAQIASKFGYQVGDDNATTLQRLGHYMSLQTQQAAAAMGANTDQARGTAEAAATGNGTWSPEAIKSTAKVFDAYATGMGKFNEGLEAYIANNQGVQGPWAARQFKNAWSQNFDPVAMQILNAKMNGDNAEYVSLLKANKNNGQLKQRMLNLGELIQGKMPGARQ